MAYEQIIVSEIAAGRDTRRAILDSQRTLMRHDVYNVIRRLLYSGKIVSVGRGRYKVAQ